MQIKKTVYVKDTQWEGLNLLTHIQEPIVYFINPPKTDGNIK